MNLSVQRTTSHPIFIHTSHAANRQGNNHRIMETLPTVYKDGSGAVSGRISAGFSSHGSGLGMIFHPRFLGSRPRNLSVLVSGLVFHPWISEISH